jgi:hypothetical protein
MSDYQMFTIDAPLLPPIHGMKVMAASMSHARNKALKAKYKEMNILLATDILKCPFGDIHPNRQKRINRKAMAVIQSQGTHRFTMSEAWRIAMPDVEGDKMRRTIRHAMIRTRIAYLRRNGNPDEVEPMIFNGKAAIENGNGYYGRHPEMMLKPEFRS